MRAFLIAVLVLSVTANAQEVKCPESYPNGDIPLAMPSGQQGSARLQPAFLSMAYMYVGEQYGQQYLVGPDVANSKGGMDVPHGFRPEDSKWLVCVYGGSEWERSKPRLMGKVELWEKLDQKITSCILKLRKVKASYSPSAWTATAVCK
jgi:hypothetical protein